MIRFKKKVTTSLQFEDNQYRWLEDKALERCAKEKRYVSISAILREIVQQAIDNKEITENEQIEENKKLS